MANTQAQNKAKELLQKEGYSIPVDIKGIAKNCGIRVMAEDFEDDLSGVLIVKDDQPYIFVNRKHHRNRQRFTIAHELGHFALRNFEEVHVDNDCSLAYRNSRSSTGEVPHEVEANQFAAEILMPTEEIQKRIKGFKNLITDSIIEVMAKEFEVSPQAMTVRLTSLGYLG